MAKRQRRSEWRGCLGGLGEEESTLGRARGAAAQTHQACRAAAADESARSQRGQNVHRGTLYDNFRSC